MKLRARRRLLLAGVGVIALAAGRYLWRALARMRKGPPPPPQPPRAPWAARAGVAAGAPWDLTGIVGTGQSLAVGASGRPLVATKPSFGNLKLSLGSARVPPYDPNDPELALAPLVEPIRAFAVDYPGAYPHNIYGETPHTAMAHQISSLARAELRREYVSVHTVVGESGQPMEHIARSATPTRDVGHAWAASLFEVQAITRLAHESGKRYGVGAIVLTHGESDAERSDYEAELHQLWEDYNADISAITGQNQMIPLLLTQQHSVPTEPGTIAASTLAAWRAASAHPGRIVCVGPKYQYAYVDDHVHLTALSYTRLGEKYGQVFFRHVVQNQPFRPLEPLRAERDGRQLTLHFHVPVAPLRWDATMPLPHQNAFPEWRNGRGFEVLSGADRQTIEAVEIVDPHGLRITCTRDLHGPVTLRYALTADGKSMPGGTARWGNLCDSDPFVGSLTHTPQPNYAVAFELIVP